jgi:hypothetical protein
MPLDLVEKLEVELEVVAPGGGWIVGAEGRVGSIGAQQRGQLDHRPSPAPAGRRRCPGRRADVPQRIAVLAVERRPVPRGHAAGARGRAREISTAAKALRWGSDCATPWGDDTVGDRLGDELRGISLLHHQGSKDDTNRAGAFGLC